MICPACRNEVPADAAFCSHCGAKMNPLRPAPSPVTAQGAPPSNAVEHAEATEAFKQNPHSHQVPSDDIETEIWRGSYSPKGMIGSWILAGLITAIVVTMGLFFAGRAPDPKIVWIGIAGFVAIVWLGLMLRLVRRRMSILYRLTNVRFFYEVGVLRRVTDRIEVIHIDDVKVTQGFVQRMLGVGDIELTTSDKTAPSIWLMGIDDVTRVADMIDTVRRELRNRRGVRIEQI